MIPSPDFFTGSRKQRRLHCRKVYEDVELLITRESVYRIGEHPQIQEINRTWRKHVATMSLDDCRAFLAMIERDWPARKIRP
jgi:hypothetical protein